MHAENYTLQYFASYVRVLPEQGSFSGTSVVPAQGFTALLLEHSVRYLICRCFPVDSIILTIIDIRLRIAEPTCDCTSVQVSSAVTPPQQTYAQPLLIGLLPAVTGMVNRALKV